MTSLSPHDFDSSAGQEKIIKTIYTLDHKVRELQQIDFLLLTFVFSYSAHKHLAIFS